MSSAYGKIARPAGVSADALQSLLPLAGTLRDGTAVSLVAADPASAAVVGQLHALLNRIIEDGDTYPQEEPMTEAAFRSYFLSHDAFVVTDDAGTIYGAFYVKPNFPGRCSHVCNGGFIVEHAQRGKGVGTVMANAFKQIAPLLGYKASMFNLVFASNQASVALWRRTGFAEIGRLPGAGRLRGSDTLVDAIMFHCAFETRTVSR
ncbi:acyl-CoA N-acyltransferase [Entophlyctis helioformis]|nr:acyl-CoA N-acyltransferase [Entophlyctis helioformis]